MVESFASLVNPEVVTAVLAVTFLTLSFIGITDFQKNTEKMGE